MSLERIAGQDEERNMLLRRAEAALADGRITQTEHDFYVTQVINKRAVHQPTMQATSSNVDARRQTMFWRYAAVFMVMLLAIAGMYFFAGEFTPTGFVTFTPYQEVSENLISILQSNTSIDLNVSGSRPMVSGALVSGSATISFVSNGSYYVLFDETVRQEEYYVRTKYTSYAINDTIELDVQPRGATLWLTVNNERELVGKNITLQTPGEYTVDALFNSSSNIGIASTSFIVREDTNTSQNIERETKGIVFNEECGQACDLEFKKGVLKINLTEGTVLRLDNITYRVERENEAPRQIAQVPNVEVALGETKILDLSEYFIDQDELYYDYMTISGVELEIEGSELTITGNTVGEYQSVIYTSDLYELVQSNSFTISVVNTKPIQNINKTPIKNTTPQSTNQPTQNNTQLNKPNNCLDPDPNKRSPECFVGEENDYFRNEDGFTIENRARKPVARFNALGNLLITGDVIENSNGDPGSGDFSVGYNDDFDFVVTAWIDSSGNLHLRGTLHEEKLTLAVPARTYSFQSRKGINLGYIEPVNGDMYLRGNVIPYRRSIS